MKKILSIIGIIVCCFFAVKKIIRIVNNIGEMNAESFEPQSEEDYYSIEANRVAFHNRTQVPLKALKEDGYYILLEKDTSVVPGEFYTANINTNIPKDKIIHAYWFNHKIEFESDTLQIRFKASTGGEKVEEGWLKSFKYYISYTNQQGIEKTVIQEVPYLVKKLKIFTEGATVLKAGQANEMNFYTNLEEAVNIIFRCQGGKITKLDKFGKVSILPNKGVKKVNVSLLSHGSLMGIENFLVSDDLE